MSLLSKARENWRVTLLVVVLAVGVVIEDPGVAALAAGAVDEMADLVVLALPEPAHTAHVAARAPRLGIGQPALAPPGGGTVRMWIGRRIAHGWACGR